MTKEEILLQYYGYKSFRYPQGEIIDTVVSGKDCIGLLPTGFGKSVIFQVPALLFSGITLVISPLISLMEDQVTNLEKKGIKACYINSSLKEESIKEHYSLIEENYYKIIYTTPERLRNSRFIDLVTKKEISLLVVDEAHTLVWGIDFRSDFLRINDFINQLNNRPVILALTATANQKTIDFISNTLKLNEPKIFFTTFDRPNLYYGVIRTSNKLSILQDYLKKHSEDCGIIYVLTKKTVMELSYLLNNLGYVVSFYHGGLSNEVKKRNQILFLSSKVKIMVATISFGMGIDKANIRYIINYEIPMSISDLVQMSGRCSRDGKKGECIFLYDKADLNKCYFLAKEGLSEHSFFEKRKILADKYREISIVIEYAHTKTCLHRFICNYYSEKKVKNCLNCSNCKDIYKLLK